MVSTVLTSGHLLSSRRLHLLGLLNQCAQTTEGDGAEVADTAAWYVPGVSDLASHLQECYHVGYWHEEDGATEEARFAHCLRVLAEGVARDEVGDQTQADVVEATKETVLELGHGAYLLHGKMVGDTNKALAETKNITRCIQII